VPVEHLRVKSLARDNLGTDHPDLLNKISDDEFRSWVEIVA